VTTAWQLILKPFDIPRVQQQIVHLNVLKYQYLLPQLVRDIMQDGRS
jgi:hypothetical protein